MKNILKFLICTITLSFAAEVQNIQVEQRRDGSGIIDVTYDLIDDTFPSFTIAVEFSLDDSEFEPYPFGASNMSGDVGENVIPGLGKSIQINAPEETYSTNVIIKIKASAYMVTTELPFSMIAISSIEGVSSYQGEVLDYNFEIMQNELTNADLVTFLETYEFTLTDDSPIYDCNDYTDYYSANDDDDNDVYGCTNDEAYNYNSLATFDDGSCIMSGEDLGCTSDTSLNYNNGAMYDDCSCWTEGYINGDYIGSGNDSDQCDWNSHPNCYPGENFADDSGAIYCDVNSNGLPNFTIWPNYTYTVELCNDSEALNFPDGIQTFLDNLPNPECFIVNPGECVFECDYGISGGDNSYEDENWGQTNIEDFETQDISFEGSSFVIESGAGTKPAIFNYENCVDGVIVGLLLNHYGLRYPTGAEWTKSARQDNDRCWPWMSGTCEEEASSYCSDTYTCMTEEEFDTCEETANGLQLECQQSCNSESSQCSQGCDGSGDDGGQTDCGSILFYDTCQNTDSCDWDEDSNFCIDSCYDCMMYTNDTSCMSDPCNGDCECCDVCDDQSGGFDWECQETCNNVMMTCMNDCGNTYGNTYEYCGGENMNNCNWDFESCSGDYNDSCKIFDFYNYASLQEGTYDNDEHGFLSYVYSNKFHFEYNADYSNETTISVVDIAQYPDGISSFGLYDMIGNAPEVVKHNNKLWLTGLIPASSSLVSFCSDNGIFGEGWSDHAIGLSDNSSGPGYRLYGLRLARITQ